MEISVRNLQHVFKEKRLFNNLGFTISDGTFCVIYGPSGSGKSTILNLLSGLIQPQKGNITIMHEGQKLNIHNRKFREEHLNYIFQNFALLENETVFQNLSLPFIGRKLSQNKKVEMIEEALMYVGLQDEIKQFVSTLSGGEQSRIALARALLTKGDLILADEPTGNLDEKNRDIVIQLLLSLQKKGKTVVVVTHDPVYREYADQVIEL